VRGVDGTGQNFPTLPHRMTDRDFDSGSRHYGRWSYPWRSEDDWGPITAAVVIVIILAGLIVYSGIHL
jgi:hypothetical protein